jgi:hypothetical protein
MDFDVTSVLANVIFKLSFHRIKRFTDSNQEVFISLPIHDQLAARHSQIEPHLEWSATPMMANRGFDDDAAAQDAVKVCVKSVCPFANLSLDAWG